MPRRPVACRFDLDERGWSCMQANVPIEDIDLEHQPQGVRQSVAVPNHLAALAPAMLKELNELGDWLEDMHDGAPDSDPLYRQAGLRAGSIRQLLRKVAGGAPITPDER